MSFSGSLAQSEMQTRSGFELLFNVTRPDKKECRYIFRKDKQKSEITNIRNKIKL